MKKNRTFKEKLSLLHNRYYPDNAELSHRENLYFRQSLGRMLNRCASVGLEQKELLAAFLRDLPGQTLRLNDCAACRRFARAYSARKAIRPELSWSHYKIISRLKSKAARQFYTQVAADEQWSIAELYRQVNTRYYARSQQKINRKPHDAGHDEIFALLKEEYVIEFTGLTDKETFSEQDLENALTTELRAFMTELGQGYAFIARQKHLTLDTGKDYYIDLVFYNYLQKRFVLIELKKGELCHRDIGQMDMYVRLYDRKYRKADDKPTVGIIFCRKKDPELEKHSVLEENGRLFAAVYRMK